VTRLGARSVVAVEANARAYLRCLIARELLDIPRTRFLLGDVLAYMRSAEQTFDVGLACAFLNHLTDPVEAIALLARCCRSVFVWNVVYDQSLFAKQPEMAPRFGPAQGHVHGGFSHTLYPHYYGDGLDYRKFLGGVQPSCCWMKSAEVVAALRHFGFTSVLSHEEDNPFGRAVSAVAVKP
jgi:hypothetical protein